MEREKGNVKTPACEIKGERSWDAVRITINGTPHIQFVESKFVGFQSWIMAGEGRYFIEITMSGGGVITSDYDCRKKWETIAGLLADLSL